MLGTARIFLGVVLLLSGCSAATSCRLNAAEPAGSDQSFGKNTLVIGKVSDNPKKHYQYLKPMLDYAVEKMKDLGIENGRVLMAKDNEQMIEYLKSGRVDWVTETAFSALLYEHYNAAQILLRKWKKEAPEYYTIFFARRDSGIDSLRELKGKILALEDPGSTTAFFEPFLCLVAHGLELQKLDSYRKRPAPDKVGYVLSRQEINTSMWVHEGRVDAGAFNNQDWNKSDHLYKNMKKDLKIFYKSDPLPRAFELVRKDLDPKIKARLKKILLHAHADGGAQRALREYQRTKRFDELDAATLRVLNSLRRDLRTYLERSE